MDYQGPEIGSVVTVAAQEGARVKGTVVTATNLWLVLDHPAPTGVLKYRTRIRADKIIAITWEVDA